MKHSPMLAWNYTGCSYWPLCETRVQPGHAIRALLHILRFHNNKLEFHFKLVCSYFCFNKDSKFYFEVDRGSFRLLPIGGAKQSSTFLPFLPFTVHTHRHTFSSKAKAVWPSFLFFCYFYQFNNLSCNAAFSITNLMPFFLSFYTTVLPSFVPLISALMSPIYCI